MIKLTEQRAFDIAVKRLADGKGRAMFPDSAQCTYYGPYGETCVVGAMLTKKIRLMVRNARIHVSALINHYDEVKERLPDNKPFLLKLQQLHDDKQYWNGNTFIRWDEMLNIAETYGLNTKSLKKVMEV